MVATDELDPRLWPDAASTTPVTIMVHGTPLTLPARGTPMSVPGPWKTGRKGITQRKAETADEFVREVAPPPEMLEISKAHQAACAAEGKSMQDVMAANGL